MKYRQVKCAYGATYLNTTVFVAEHRPDFRFYACEDSSYIFITKDAIQHGANIGHVVDAGQFEADAPMYTLEDFMKAMEQYVIPFFTELPNEAGTN